MQRICTVLSVAIVAYGSGVARADNAKPLDDQFLIKVAPWENAEIDIGKLAEKRASSPKVREFAAQLVGDHQKSYDRLGQAIKGRKIAVVSGLEGGLRSEVDRLSKLQGADFDREFLKTTIASHRKAIPIFESQAKHGGIPGIRSFASEALPKLREHLKRAEELAKSPN